MRIPLVDLKAQHASISSEIDEAMQRVIGRTAFVGGAEVADFENAFADFCVKDNPAHAPQHAYCASCGNGTDALYLTLRAMDIGEGDEVVTASHTFIATAEAITMTGATPVFVDVEADTLLMDPDQIAAAVTERTRAIIAVHLYGQPCDMDRIRAIAKAHNLKVIEDAAQAHGATWKGQRVGTLADAACFSFYPGKNLGAYGDGGAVVSVNEDLVERVRMTANHGRLTKYTHEFPAVNSRLDGLQAAILGVKLRHLDKWNLARQAAAQNYSDRLIEAGLANPTTPVNESDKALVLPAVGDQATSVFHLFVIQTDRRAHLQAHLQGDDIATGIHYPVPLHLQPAYTSLGMIEGSLPVTERAAGRIVSLPMFPELTVGQIDRIVESVMSALG